MVPFYFVFEISIFAILRRSIDTYLHFSYTYTYILVLTNPTHRYRKLNILNIGSSFIVCMLYWT